MKVLVGMSGGVDSSAAAGILKDEGYEVTGAYMDMIRTGSSDSDARDAKAVCDRLGIPFVRLDMTEVFRNEVQTYFADSYLNGLTPNPCIVCNKKIKFGAFMDAACKMGFGFIATGHYAKIVNSRPGLPILACSSHPEKDQSYFLYHLSPDTLSHVIFPLEGKTKDEVRSYAAKLGFNVADKKDSQDICFVKDEKYTDFIENFTGKKMIPGRFTDPDGNVIGTHDGIPLYTVGQRKGVRTSFGRPLYVIDKNPADNTVMMGPDELLYKTELSAGDIYVHPDYKASLMSPSGLRVTAKHRYNRRGSPATAYLSGDGTVRVRFDAPERAITPGQTLAMYDGEYVVGGGTIVR